MSETMIQEEEKILNKLDAMVIIKIALHRHLKDSGKPMKKAFNKKTIFAYITVMEDIEREIEDLKRMEENESSNETE